jgi:hypothetical protein
MKNKMKKENIKEEIWIRRTKLNADNKTEY